MAEARPRAMAWERYAPLSGALAVVCWVVGLLLIDVANKDKGPELLAAYKAHDGRIWGAGTIWLIGIALFVWFLGSLRARLLAAEGPTARLTTLAFAGGVGTAICGALIPAGDVGAASAKDHIDASSAVALHNMMLGPFFAAEYLCVVLFVATALVALRTGAVLPRWFAWVTLLLALGLIVSPVGWAVLIFGVPLWILIVTFLLSRPGPAQTAV